MTKILQDIAGVAVALGGFELIKWSANLIINRRNEKRKAEAKELLSQPRPEADEPTQEGGEDEIL